MILLLHHRYRHRGGEERAVEDLRWLIEHELGEPAGVLARDSESVTPAAAAAGLLNGGLRPDAVREAVERTRARVVHAHNLHPTFGARALQAAKRAGARTVLHLHNYRLVCAIGIAYTRGADCTRCHGTDTRPGFELNCRDGSRAEAAAYALGLARQLHPITEAADAFIVPSAFALQRLKDLGAPHMDKAHVIPSVQRTFAERSTASDGQFALVAGRLAAEKGFADAIDACKLAKVPLVIAGDGPGRNALERRAGAADVRFTGRLEPDELAKVRAGAALAIVPSRYQEILPLAALEAMAAGLPVVAADAGGLREVAADRFPIGDVAAAAELIRARYGDAEAGDSALAKARELTAPAAVAARLRAVYDAH